MGWGKKQTPEQQLEAAQKTLAGAKQHQKDLKELRTMPGYKKALGSSADAIHKAEKNIKRIKKEHGL